MAAAPVQDAVICTYSVPPVPARVETVRENRRRRTEASSTVPTAPVMFRKGKAPPSTTGPAVQVRVPATGLDPVAGAGTARLRAGE